MTRENANIILSDIEMMCEAILGKSAKECYEDYFRSFNATSDYKVNEFNPEIVGHDEDGTPLYNGFFEEE